MTNRDVNRIELEEKAAFLERTVEELSDVVLAQGSTIEALERRLDRLEGRLAVALQAAGEESDPLDERPPHY